MQPLVKTHTCERGESPKKAIDLQGCMIANRMSDEDEGAKCLPAQKSLVIAALGGIFIDTNLLYTRLVMFSTFSVMSRKTTTNNEKCENEIRVRHKKGKIAIFQQIYQNISIY